MYVLKILTISTAFLLSFTGVSFSENFKTTVDGINVVVKKEKTGTVVVLDVVHGKKRDIRREQAVRAAKQATGCDAVIPKGKTVFDFQGKSEKPTFVQVKLKC